MRTHNYSHSHFTEEDTGRIQEAVQGHPAHELQDGKSNPSSAYRWPHFSLTVRLFDFSYFDTRSSYVALAGLVLAICLPGLKLTESCPALGSWVLGL